MVEYNKASKDDKLDLLFHALSDRTRRNIVENIKSKPSTVSDLASKYDVSLNAVSKHIKVLEKAQIIVRKVEGRTHYCHFNPKEFKRIQSWISKYEKFWNQRLDALEEFIKKN